ncbi:MAG: hypothetical protein MMC33_009590 [Icmadophila ericetorum]|nr:hypothetical protein [Icmadophila ericetorum]
MTTATNTDFVASSATSRSSPELSLVSDHMEIRASIPNAVSPLKYALHLGVLVYVQSDAGDAAETPIKTPFDVFIDIEDRSIWLVLDPDNYDDEGSSSPIPASADTWEYLPSLRKSKPFDIMRILDEKDCTQLDATTHTKHQIFSERVLESGRRVAPMIYTALGEAVSKVASAPRTGQRANVSRHAKPSRRPVSSLAREESETSAC